MLLYYITDRTQFPGNRAEQRRRLLERINEAARCGVDYVQLREKDLSTRELERLAREAAETVRASGDKTRLVINSRTDVALAVGADGVHLRSKDVSPEDVRQIWRKAGRNDHPVIAVSCHTEQQVVRAAEARADFVVFGPIFEKRNSPEFSAAGIQALRAASQHGIPVFALGGVTAGNSSLCIQAGAMGLAGIRLFQGGNLAETVAKLRG